MKRAIYILVLSALMAVPATADLFHWTVHNLDLSYDGTNFDASASPSSAGGLIVFTRDVPTIGTVELFPGPGVLGDFVVTNMLINNITATTADGSGTWTLTDNAGDTVTGNVTGVWKNEDDGPEFSGSLSNVWWNNESGDNDFDGWDYVGTVPTGTYVAASLSMGFSSPLPWSGSILHLTADTASWFGDGAWTSDVLAAGSVDAHVVPVPAAFLLGMLGMSVAGLKLRKHA